MENKNVTMLYKGPGSVSRTTDGPLEETEPVAYATMESPPSSTLSRRKSKKKSREREEGERRRSTREFRSEADKGNSPRRERRKSEDILAEYRRLRSTPKKKKEFDDKGLLLVRKKSSEVEEGGRRKLEEEVKEKASSNTVMKEEEGKGDYEPLFSRDEEKLKKIKSLKIEVEPEGSVPSPLSSNFLKSEGGESKKGEVRIEEEAGTAERKTSKESKDENKREKVRGSKEESTKPIPDAPSPPSSSRSTPAKVKRRDLKRISDAQGKGGRQSLSLPEQGEGRRRTSGRALERGGATKKRVETSPREVAGRQASPSFSVASIRSLRSVSLAMSEKWKNVKKWTRNSFRSATEITKKLFKNEKNGQKNETNIKKDLSADSNLPSLQLPLPSRSSISQKLLASFRSFKEFGGTLSSRGSQLSNSPSVKKVKRKILGSKKEFLNFLNLKNEDELSAPEDSYFGGRPFRSKGSGEEGGGREEERERREVKVRRKRREEAEKRGPDSKRTLEEPPPPKETPSPPREEEQVWSAYSRYLVEHKIQEKVQKMLSSLVVEQPLEPSGWMARFMERGKEKKEETKEEKKKEKVEIDTQTEPSNFINLTREELPTNPPDLPPNPAPPLPPPPLPRFSVHTLGLVKVCENSESGTSSRLLLLLGAHLAMLTKGNFVKSGAMRTANLNLRHPMSSSPGGGGLRSVLEGTLLYESSLASQQAFKDIVWGHQKVGRYRDLPPLQSGQDFSPSRRGEKGAESPTLKGAAYSSRMLPGRAQKGGDLETRERRVGTGVDLWEEEERITTTPFPRKSFFKKPPEHPKNEGQGGRLLSSSLPQNPPSVSLCLQLSMDEHSYLCEANLQPLPPCIRVGMRWVARVL